MTLLETIWRRLRLELAARAEGATGAYESQSGHQKPGSREPALGSGDLAHFDRRWRRCVTDSDRRRMLLCDDCRREDARPGGAVRCCVIGLLRSYLIVKKARRDEFGMTLDRRAEIAADPRSIHTVARAYGIGTKRVAKYREENGTVRKPGRPQGGNLIGT